MKKYIIASALLIGVSAQAHAQWGSFAGGFAGGFLRGQALRLQREQAEAQPEANSPHGHCMTMQANRIMGQKKLPPADVAKAQMDAAHAYCDQVFGR